MNKEELAALHKNYYDNLLATIKLIKDTGAFLVVAGPELLGEGPIFLRTSWLKKKPEYFDTYINLTRTAALSVPGVQYIDIRTEFQNAIPWWWKFYGGWVTIEGEHPNDRGAWIEAKLFADQLNAN